MQPPLPAPTASGAFSRTPFPHLLVYAMERGLTGTFELSRGMATMASIVMVGGCPAKVQTQEPVHFLGEVLLELGVITPDQLQMSLDRMNEPGQPARLQGQILLEAGVVDEATLDAGLRAQVERKVEHLFGLSNETMFAYYDGLDLLSEVGGPPTPIDPFPVLWRGVRETPAWEHVDATLRRIGTALLRASSTSQLDRFAFTPQELQVVELLHDRPTRILDVTSIVGPNVGQVLIYFLMIMKQVDLLDAAQVQAAAQARVSALPPPPPPTPASGQAVARLQLQRQTPRAAFVVEEVIAAQSGRDDRSSSPRIVPASAFGPAVMDDIGSMISDSMHPSGPPASGRVSGAPAPPPSAPPSGPQSRPSVTPLTPEQSTLKTKIVERAEQITSQDYFTMLSVARDATPEQVQAAFFALAKVWHPDRLPPALVDVKDACSKVFTHLTEAHATLMDSVKRHDYMTLLKDGGATPDDQAKIMAILEAATEFQKVEVLLKRNPTDPQAYEIIKRCVGLDSTQADYLATLAWLDAQRPEWLSREKTLEKCLLLDRCVKINPFCERAYFYRGLLYKRAEEPAKALKDFKKASELNPRNLDAMREVRLHKMRGGMQSKPPPGTPGGGPRPSTPPKAPEPDKLGKLFGKLFKK